MQKSLVIEYGVDSSFNSLLAMSVAGSLLFETHGSGLEGFTIPKNINTKLFTELLEKIKRLHEEHRIILEGNEIVLYYITLALTSNYFRYFSFESARKILPMLLHKNENDYFGMIKNYFSYSGKMIRFISEYFGDDDNFQNSLLMFGNLKLNKIQKISN
jgi:hypothetical protein